MASMKTEWCIAVLLIASEFIFVIYYFSMFAVMW